MDVSPVRSQGSLDWPMTMAGRVETEYKSVHVFERERREKEVGRKDKERTRIKELRPSGHRFHRALKTL